MDQDTVVSEQTDSGRRIIEALAADGFDVRVAFWAKPTDEGKWFLYLASPIVDDKGPAAAYRLVHRIMRALPDLWIDPLEIRVVGVHDSIAEAALEVTNRNPKLYPGMTRFGDSTLGGVSVDGAYIYPPPQPGVSA
jgi:hypothetical protein